MELQRATVLAVDQQTEDLALLGVQQDRAALSAGVVDRTVACLKHRRGVLDVAYAGRANYSEGDSRVRELSAFCSLIARQLK